MPWWIVSGGFSVLCAHRFSFGPRAHTCRCYGRSYTDSSSARGCERSLSSQDKGRAYSVSAVCLVDHPRIRVPREYTRRMGTSVFLSFCACAWGLLFPCDRYTMRAWVCLYHSLLFRQLISGLFGVRFGVPFVSPCDHVNPYAVSIWGIHECCFGWARLGPEIIGDSLQVLRIFHVSVLCADCVFFFRGSVNADTCLL